MFLRRLWRWFRREITGEASPESPIPPSPFHLKATGPRQSSRNAPRVKKPRAEAPEPIPASKPQLNPIGPRQSLGDGAPQVRKAAAGAPRPIPAWKLRLNAIGPREGLRDDDPQVRKAAAEAMGEDRDASFVESLCQALPDPAFRIDVSGAACDALVKIGTPAVDRLIRMVAGDLPAFLREKDYFGNCWFPADTPGGRHQRSKPPGLRDHAYYVLVDSRSTGDRGSGNGSHGNRH